MVERHIAKRLENLDSEINDLVSSIVDQQVRELTAVAFGVDSRYGRLEPTRDFASHPIGSMLSAAAAERAKKIVDQITGDKNLVNSKTLSKWHSAYKSYYNEELERTVDKLIRRHADDRARNDAEDAFRRALAQALEGFDDG
jgi:hypothetical protein